MHLFGFGPKIHKVTTIDELITLETDFFICEGEDNKQKASKLFVSRRQHEMRYQSESEPDKGVQYQKNLSEFGFRGGVWQEGSKRWIEILK